MRGTYFSALVAAASLASSAQGQQFYRIESAVTMKSAEPSWDYLAFEPKRSYLYIARRQDGLAVYDTAAKKLVRTIASSSQANAATLLSELDRGYTTNEDGSTTVFQLSTLKTIKRVKLSESADSAVYEPATRQLAFTLGDEKQILFFDPRTDLVTGKVEVPSSKLEHPVPDGEGLLFLAERDRDSIARIDAKTRTLVGEWKAGCEEPNGLALDASNKRLFIGCRGKGKAPLLAVMDIINGKVVATAEIGRGNDGVVYDAETRKVYTSNGVDGNLVILDQVDADTYRLAEAPTTRPSARTMAFDAKTKKIYLVTAEGTVDPAKKVNRAVAPFYPNTYFADTFTLLTLAPSKPAHASITGPVNPTQ